MPGEQFVQSPDLKIELIDLQVKLKPITQKRSKNLMGFLATP
jgi:hypothetical protein